MMTNKDIRQEARQLLTRVSTKRYIFAVPLLILPLANGLVQIDSRDLGLSLTALSLQILLGLFLVSAALTMLDIWRGEKMQANFTDSTRSFSRQFIGKLILVELVGTLYFLLPYLLVVGLGIGLILGLTPLIPDLSTGNQWAIIISISITLLIGLATLLPLYYAFKQTTYVLYDQVQNGNYRNPHHVLMTSYRLMKGHRKQAFLLDLSFIGWSLLTPITLGLVMIYSLPYYTSATAIFYDNLIKQETDKLTE